MNAVERRVGPRAPLSASADVLDGNERIACRTLDISSSGMAVVCPFERPTGSYVRVRFALTETAHAGRRHAADGVVVRVQPRGAGYLWGIEFAVLDGEAVGEILEYVASNTATSDGPARRDTGEYGQGESPPSIAKSERKTKEVPPVQSPVDGVDGTPGFPGGPTCAPVTGEYLPGGGDPSEPAAAEPAKKTGTDDYPRVGLSGRPITGPEDAEPTPQPYKRNDDPLDRELLNLYLLALRDVDTTRKRGPKK